MLELPFQVSRHTAYELHFFCDSHGTLMHRRSIILLPESDAIDVNVRLLEFG